VLLTPVLLALIFGGIAMAFRMYGENLALDAANAGARAAAVLPVSADRGRLAAQEFLDQNAAGTLSDTSVTVDLAGNDVVVSITGRTPILPGTVSRQSSLVVERLP
jgi:Flp pilus assembly protein TadG